MNWFDLIFSDQPRKRYLRHAIFWITWLLYFAGSFFFTQQGLDEAGSAKWIFIIFIKSLLLLLGHTFIVYAFIYFLLPRFMLKARYIFFAGGVLSAGAITIAWSFFCYALLFPPLDSFFHLSNAIAKNALMWNSISGGLISALKVIAAATAIKLLKRWYLKQKENERLEKEKISVELQLLKAQIHPDVLFSSLDNIYLFAQNNTTKASELLLKLSDLLSYILYECEQSMVPLEKEIKMLKDYMALEKTRMGDKLEISISVKGNAHNKIIVPLLLLPFVENSFLHCGYHKLEKTWINLDIRIEGNDLSMKLVNGKSPDQEIPTAPNENGLGNVHKRLNLLYPGKNEIRILAEPEMMMTFLKIKLEDDTFSKEKNETDNNTVIIQTTANGAM